MNATALAQGEGFSYAKEKRLSGKATGRYGHITLPDEHAAYSEPKRQCELMQAPQLQIVG